MLHMKKIWLFALILGLVLLAACGGGSEEGTNEDQSGEDGH